ncbi:hypothetical protein CEXT_329221 [Caerostris extrusa]|uniref:Uncharacterized protein n=1 Tax=Caerostris extrusa TaxID=172846 RepID=A0AAV4U7P1_CAEEX|nr:hypothetical protein CEXT_329221 [Caerostris extrusa]
MWFGVLVVMWFGVLVVMWFGVLVVMWFGVLVVMWFGVLVVIWFGVLVVMWFGVLVVMWFGVLVVMCQKKDYKANLSSRAFKPKFVEAKAYNRLLSMDPSDYDSTRHLPTSSKSMVYKCSPISVWVVGSDHLQSNWKEGQKKNAPETQDLRTGPEDNLLSSNTGDGRNDSLVL